MLLLLGIGEINSNMIQTDFGEKFMNTMPMPTSSGA
jgi:hypothetical protein